MAHKRCLLSVYTLACILSASSKYLEGELHTTENWAFLARFCFLSEEGQFEYYIEYDDDQGEPNLLLYYDAEDQWPAVYKSDKKCGEREAVLHTEQYQIINLTAKFPFYKELSGCVQTPPPLSTPRPRYTLSVPTLPSRRKRLTTLVTGQVTETQDAPSSTVPYSTSTFETSTISIISSSENLLESFNYSTTQRDPNLDFENLQAGYEKTTTAKIKSSAVVKRSVVSTPKAEEKNKRIICRNARRFRSSRERWWFLAVSNCKGSKGIHISYKILMTNGPQGDYWHEHFSADEFYVLPILMAFTVAYSFLLLAIVICSIELKSRQLLHTTYKLFVFSVIVQFFGIVFCSMAYLKYAVNGVGAPKIKLTGSLFMGTSETCFLLLLLLLAKGYTITRGRLPVSASIKLTVFMCVYVVTHASLFVYEAKVFDPGEVLYLYESPAGYGLIILRIGAWCMFIYSTVFTLKHYPEKSNFYYPFNICGTLWFIAGPAFVLSANTYIDKWVRESVVYAVLLFITFAGHLMFMVLTMPSVANKNFPYHVRTTQIGVMEVTGSEQFNHHVYEPSAAADQTIIIPLSRRTEEVFGGVYDQMVNSTILQPPPDRDRTNDLAMQNVLTWSVAKNYNPLEIPHLRNTHNTLSPANSKTSGQSSASGGSKVDEGKALNLSQDEIRNSLRNGFHDYVKEVPVELFTISKMVVSAPSNKDTQ